MSAPSPSLSVWVADDLVCVRVAGRATCNNSVDFRRLMLGLRDKGHARFVLDLSQCPLMDSTFLGVMAWLVLQFAEGRPPARIELLNPNSRITYLLDNLGVAHLFPSHQGPGVGGPAGETIVANPGPEDHTEMARTALEAHELLSRLDPRNAGRFKDVCAFLRDDLEKLARKQGAGAPAEPEAAGARKP